MIDPSFAQRLQRYDRPGPRYTSYPTVPVWTEGFGPSQLEAALREAGRADPQLPLSLYVHLPFCREMCTYCGCNVVISSDRRKHAEYVEAVRAELDLMAEMLGPRRRLLQLHYGGGTPTALDEPLLLRLWEKIDALFTIERDAELAVEVDPVVTSREQLALLRGMGFNRLSMGVQDFTPQVQQAVNRIQSVEQTEDLASYARKLGYGGINFDLIYGLPHQDLESFARTMDEVIRIGPDRVATFSYAHVPEARGHQKKIDPATLPMGLAKYELFVVASEKLHAAGYVSIGMDHFARATDELAVAQSERRLSRNFQGYTVRPAPDIIAAGSTGIADVSSCYAQNVRPLGAYYRNVRAGRLATERGIRLTPDDRLRRDAITQIMCNFHLDLNALGRRHGVDAAEVLAPSIESLAPLEADGLVQIAKDHVDVTVDGRSFVRNVAMSFDAYLGKPVGGRLPVFSRTV